CKGSDQETNFIPTMPPEFTGDELDFPNDTIEDIDDQVDTPDDKEDDPVYVGETTTKYVKLSTYGAILNVRSAPTTEEDNVVGFLVHTEPIEVISIEDDWAKFLYHDEVRYVSADFLVDFVPPYVSPPTLTQTPTTTPTPAN
ncbi:MAG: SH3 domain-containing protein, partial [Anaerolineaceae bacterium]